MPQCRLRTIAERSSVFTIASRRWLTSGLVMLCFHLHLLCDILGSKGPDGYQWPIPYLKPFSDVWQLSWAGQWQLNAWQNIAITSVAILFILYQAFKRGHIALGNFLFQGKPSFGRYR
jgi:inner membrane protein